MHMLGKAQWSCIQDFWGSKQRPDSLWLKQKWNLVDHILRKEGKENIGMGHWNWIP